MHRFLQSLAVASALFFGVFMQASPALAAVINAPYGGMSSPNWSGYATQGATYSAVGGTWTVPSVTASTDTTSDSTWIGIGGINRQDLIQTGTLATSANGSVTYQAWYETLPNYPTMIPLSVRPGDSITASLTYQGNNVWLVQFVNSTTGAHFSTNVTYASSQASAEWVEEAPKSSAGPYMQLDQYGSVNFTNAWTTANGMTLTPAQASASAITMNNASGQAISMPSNVASDGASFTVARMNSAPVMQLPQATYAVAQTVRIVNGRRVRSYRRVPIAAQVAVSTTPAAGRFQTDGFALMWKVQ